MAEALVTMLEEYLATWRANPEGFLFLNRNGRPYAANKVVEYGLWPALDKLKIERVDARVWALPREFANGRRSESDSHKNSNATFGCASHSGNL
jgi:hypothetical protein